MFEKFREYHNRVTKLLEKPILTLRADNGREYVNYKFQNFCKNKGIRLQLTIPYNLQLNGVAERMNRTLVDKARTMIIDSGLPKMMWGEAIYNATYGRNRSPTTNLSKTPIELWENKKPNMSNLKIFGCNAYRQIPNVLRKKLDPKGQKLIMVGYATNTTYRLWDSENKKIVLDRNVKFDEEVKVKNPTQQASIFLETQESENDIRENDERKKRMMRKRMMRKRMMR